MYDVSRKTRVVIATVVALAMLTPVTAFALDKIHASSGGCTVAAAGDIAASGGDQQETADLIKSLNPAGVLALGDNAYQDGSDSDYRDYYDPSWGAFKTITHPTPGNHEYQTPGASGYFNYFKGVKPYYSFDLCGWHMLSLNREINGGDRSSEISFIKSDMVANKSKPMLAYWHEPRFSDGSSHGSDKGADDLWQAVVAGGAHIVLNGHEHFYERFTEMDAGGKAKAGATREMIVGEGGTPNLYDFSSSIMGTSEKRIHGAHGVMLLTLRSNGYDFALHQTSGSVADSGTATFAGSAQPATAAPAAATPAPMPAAVPVKKPAPVPAVTPAPVATPTPVATPAPVATSMPSSASDATGQSAAPDDSNAISISGDPANVNPTTTDLSAAAGDGSSDGPLTVKVVNKTLAISAGGLTGIANVDLKVTFGSKIVPLSATADSKNAVSVTAPIPTGFSGKATVVMTAGANQYTASVNVGAGTNSGASTVADPIPPITASDPTASDQTIDQTASDQTTVATPDTTATVAPVPQPVQPIQPVETSVAQTSSVSGGIQAVPGQVDQVRQLIVNTISKILSLVKSLFGK